MTPQRIRSRFNLSSDDDTVSCQDYGISWVANTRPVNELNSFICERWILSDLHLFHHWGAQEGDSWALCSSPGSCLETLERALCQCSAMHCQCSAVWGWSKCVTLSEHCGGYTWALSTVEGNLSVCFALWGIVASTLVGREYLNILGAPRQTKLTWCYTITINTPLHPFEWVTEGDQKDKHTNHMCNCACVLYIV